MFLVRSSHGLSSLIVDLAAMSHEQAKPHGSLCSSHGPSAVDHVS
jgi:hypothetical protein